MKVILVLTTIVVAVAIPSSPKGCKPSPPKNEKVDLVTSSTINVSFEDPDDITDCHIEMYQTFWEEAPYLFTPVIIRNNHLHHVKMSGLKSDTRYKISTVSTTSEGMESDPSILFATTD